jgi:hypothetical protein
LEGGSESSTIFTRFLLSRALFLNSESERAIIELEKVKDHLKNNTSQYEEVLLKDLQG